MTLPHPFYTLPTWTKIPHITLIPEPNEDMPVQPASPRDFDSLMGDESLTQESLQAELNKYAEAFRQEYETSSQSDPQNVAEYTTDFFRKNVHQAAAQIVWLATNAESESVRGNMAKYIVEQATAESDAAGDPIKELLNKLTATPAPAPDNEDSKYKSV